MKLKIDIECLRRSIDNEVLQLSSLPQEFSSTASVQEMRNERLGHLMTPPNISILAQMIDIEISQLEEEKHDAWAQKDLNMAMDYQKYTTNMA